MATRLRNLKISEVSGVDKGAGHGVKVLLMKRDAPMRREKTMASVELVAKALYKGVAAGTVGYASMLKVAKLISPGNESDATCFTRAYASGSASRVPNGPQILAAHLAKATKVPGHSRLAPNGEDGRFDLYVAMNGRRNWRDLE
jgi:hypothetical protein